MAWNVFKLCTGLRIVGSVMILVVLAIVSLSYYAVVIATYLPRLMLPSSSLQDIVFSILILVLFHSLLFMLLWCYFSVVVTDPGSVPQEWKPSTMEDLEAEAVPLASSIAQPGNGVSALSVQQPPKVRMCKKCGHFKPQRCHHCSVCGRCILKMDHHCVWVVNCVGARNYKFFLLFLHYDIAWDSPPHYQDDTIIPTWADAFLPDVFLRFYPLDVLIMTMMLYLGPKFKWWVLLINTKELTEVYTFLETTLVALALLPRFIAFFSDVEEDSGSGGEIAATFLGFVLNLAFSLSVLGFLIMHASLVTANTTTIEAYEKKASVRWKYDLGRRRNFEQVFGARKLYWPIPLYAEEDLRRISALHGLEFPSKPNITEDEF